ncbi:hypothetical protein BC830DRAFT_1145900 [Chytriomyces sp. MP71]|nr:hypothetical protein BC830DRAFT_1145900 [Chytriomyces sp. MP71]
MGTPALSELISGFHPAPVIYPPPQSRMDARKDSGVELDTVPKSISDFQFYFPMGNPSLMARAGQYTRTREAVKMLLRKSASSCSLFPSVDEETDDLEGAICHRDDLPDGKVWPERKPLEVALAELKDCFSLSRKDVSDGTRPSALFRHQFWSVMDALGLPRYCSHVLFDKLIAVKNGNANGRSAAVTSLGAEPVSTETDKGRIADEFLEFEDIERWWKDLSTVYHDDHAIIFKIMQKTSNQQYLTPLDFHTVVDEVVKRHPGLEFLSSLAVFQARYVETVITRIFFTKLHTYSERMTLAEFRKHSFLDLLIKLQIDDDINATRDVFSYKHFYVIYCKFWELDSDHNMIIEADDLYQYSQRALTTIMMDRVIAGYGKPLSAGNKSRQFSYKDFIWFMLCIEDKKRDASVDYWFRCLDLDSDGKLSLHELHEFYKQQVERMIECRMSEPWKFDDFVCSLLDLIKPKNSTYITPRDLKNSQNAALFFDMIFDLRKYDRYIRRIDPTFRDMDDVVVENRDGTRLKLDGWDKFAERSYELLAYEESSNATYQPEGMGDEDLSDEEDGHWTSREDGALGLSGWAADETAIRDESDEEDGSGHFVRGHRTSQRYGSSDEEDEEEEDMVEEVVEQIELVSTTSSSRNAGRARSKAQAKALI